MKQTTYPSIAAVPQSILIAAVKGRIDELIVVDDPPGPVPAKRTPSRECEGRYCVSIERQRRMGFHTTSVYVPIGSPSKCVACRERDRRKRATAETPVKRSARRLERLREEAKKSPGKWSVSIVVRPEAESVESVVAGEESLPAWGNGTARGMASSGAGDDLGTDLSPKYIRDGT